MPINIDIHVPTLGLVKIAGSSAAIAIFLHVLWPWVIGGGGVGCGSRVEVNDPISDRYLK